MSTSVETSPLLGFRAREVSKCLCRFHFVRQHRVNNGMLTSSQPAAINFPQLGIKTRACMLRLCAVIHNAHSTFTFHTRLLGCLEHTESKSASIFWAPGSHSSSQTDCVVLPFLVHLSFLPALASPHLTQPSIGRGTTPGGDREGIPGQRLRDLRQDHHAGQQPVPRHLPRHLPPHILHERHQPVREGGLPAACGQGRRRPGHRMHFFVFRGVVVGPGPKFRAFLETPNL